MLPPTPPPVVQAPKAPHPDAVARFLEAYDWGLPLPAAPELKGRDALRYRWLQAAAGYPIHGLPADPFPPGEDRREAEALRALLRPGPQDLARGLAALPMHLPGTGLALWRWGQAQVRRGAFTTSLRELWENRLLAGAPPLVRSYALRHALCWALADHDERRFARLKDEYQPFAEDTFALFQRLFGLLGGPSPVLRLWSLPGEGYQDLRLDQLGARRVWICPPDPSGPLRLLSPGVAWIIPTARGEQDRTAADLSESARMQAEALSARLRAAGMQAYLAPSRADMQRLGLIWFPALVVLDAQGRLQDIRMGDAAPAHP